MLSGIRSDIAVVRQTYSPAVSVNSSSNSRRLLPATPSTSTHTSARFIGLAERDNGQSELRNQITEAERHDETRRVSDHGVLASCGSALRNLCQDKVDRRHGDDVGQFDQTQRFASSGNGYGAATARWTSEGERMSNDVEHRAMGRITTFRGDANVQQLV